MEFKDYYQTLGVAKSASDKELKQAYRKLAKQYHPDLNPGRPDIEQRFKDVSGAYNLLSDPEKRGRFDRGEIDANGNEPNWDIPGVIRLLQQAGYQGAWGIESTPDDGDELGAAQKTLALLKHCLE